MTEPVRPDGFPPTNFAPPMDTSPEQRVTEWDGDHLRDLSGEAGPDPAADLMLGIDPVELTDEDLFREMESLHRTRLDTLRHAADTALATHLRRTAELETEYLTRHPAREIDPSRLRDY